MWSKIKSSGGFRFFVMIVVLLLVVGIFYKSPSTTPNSGTSENKTSSVLGATTSASPTPVSTTAISPTLSSTPVTTTPVPTSTVASTVLTTVIKTTIVPTTAAPVAQNACKYSCISPDRDCADFSSQADAQTFFLCCGFSASNDPMKLDATIASQRNGVACNSYKY